jgi:hypothetical protein
MMWTVLGRDFYKPELPGLRPAAKKLAVRLGEKTGRVINTVNMHGVTPISLLQMIEDRIAHVDVDRVCIGSTTIANLTFSA